MVDIVGLGLLVVGGYVLVKYGPAIAANIQAGQNPLAGVVPGGAAANAPLAPPAAAPPDAATQAALQPASLFFGTGTTPGTAPPAPCGKGLIADFFGRCVSPSSQSCGAGTHLNVVTGQCDADVAAPRSNPRTAAAPTPPKGFRPTITANTPPPTPSGCVPPCTPQTCPDICPPAAPNTRPKKKPTPTHAAAAAKTPPPTPEQFLAGTPGADKASQFLSTPPAPPVDAAKPPRCLCPATGNKFYQDGFPGANCPTKGEICVKSSNVGYFDGYSIPVSGPLWYETVSNTTHSANMTQVVGGKSVTSIDPFFPAGWYVAEANRKSSLHEPGLH